MRGSESSAAGFGALLRWHRLEAGLTQEELAEISGLSTGAIANMESGRTVRPYRTSVSRLADALALTTRARESLVKAARGASLSQQAADSADGAAHAVTSATTAATVAVPAKRKPAQLPADTEFTGRIGEITEAHELLSGKRSTRDHGRPARLVVVTGAGGIGKTAFAVHVAHQLSERYPDGELFIELRGSLDQPLSRVDALMRMLRHLGVDESSIPRDIDELAAEYRTQVADRRLTIVLDDARDAAQVRKLVPGTANCALLITSRGWLHGLENSRVIALDQLDDAEAFEMLTGICGTQRVIAESAAARAVLAACAGLPLAIRIAASRLVSRPGWPIGSLAVQLADEMQRLEELAVGDLAVKATFQASYAALPGQAQGQSNDAARAFRLLGLWPGPDISLPAAAALLGVANTSAARLLGILVDVHLLETPMPSRYRFHDLIRVFAAQCASDDEPASSSERAVRRVLLWFLHVADQARSSLALVPRERQLDPELSESSMAPLTFPDRASAIEWSDAERDNISAAVALAARRNLNRMCTEIASLVWTNDLRAPWDGWADVLNTAIGSAQIGGDRGEEAWLLNCLSLWLLQRGRATEALGCLDRALPLSRLAGSHLWTADIIAHRAIALRELQRYDEAAAQFEFALEVDPDLPPIHRGRILANLGDMFLATGRVAEGASLLENALKILHEGNDHELDALVLSQLAQAYRKLGRPDDALTAAKSALQISRDAHNEYQEAAATHALGLAMAGTGQLDMGQTLLSQALDLARRLGIPQAAEIAADFAALDGKVTASLTSSLRHYDGAGRGDNGDRLGQHRGSGRTALGLGPADNTSLER